MSQNQGTDPLLTDAMDWLLRLEEAPEDTGLSAAAEAWAATSPAHMRAWSRARRAWELTGAVPPVHVAAWVPGAALPPPLSTRPLQPLARGRRRLLPILALSAAACAGVAVLPKAMRQWRADYATGTGEVRRFTLPDGSLVSLAPRSAINIHYESDSRRMTLLQGEAFFEVTPDAARPFSVLAGGLVASVLGTAFSFRMGRETWEVAVQHGHVRLGWSGATPPLQADLLAGDRLVVTQGGAPRRDRMPPDEIAGWRNGPLFFQNATVAEVVERLGPYHDGWVLLRDPALAARRVTGLYDPRDPGRALRALVQPLGGQVREITPLLYIITAGA